MSAATHAPLPVTQFLSTPACVHGRLRVQQVADAPQEVGTLEAVKVKLLLLGDESAPSAIRVELTSENDLFFNYIHTLDEAGFRQVQEAQKLMVEFADYSSVLTRMLDTCIVRLPSPAARLATCLAPPTLTPSCGRTCVGPRSAIRTRTWPYSSCNAAAAATWISYRTWSTNLSSVSPCSYSPRIMWPWA